MAPTRPVPDGQAKEFNIALAEHLGLDPHRLIGIKWVIDGDPEGKARVTWTGVDLVDEQIVLDLFNRKGHTPMTATTTIPEVGYFATGQLAPERARQAMALFEHDPARADYTSGDPWFDLYMRLVDRQLVRTCGLRSADLEDYRYRDNYVDGVPIATTVREVLEWVGA